MPDDRGFDRNEPRPASGLPARGTTAGGEGVWDAFTPGPDGTAVAAQAAGVEARRLVAKMTKQAFNEGYARAHARFAEKLVELEQLIVEQGLAPGASEGERRLALAAVRQVADRIGGKPSQHVETSSDESDAAALARMIEAYGERGVS